ncbi:MAG: hypothetical protein GX224_02805 [Thermoplasmatales archaeon]|nr:hypothetical protein [Thermoplasmatales archaeon]
MACFLVPAAIGIFTLAIRNKVPEKYHIGWLNVMIWASVIALAVEHVWSGEIVPWFPFLTAVEDGNTMEMLVEMAQIGIPMALAAIGAWAALVFVHNRYVMDPSVSYA